MKKLLPKSVSIKGFTLVELLVVISIIAILAVVGLTIFSGVQSRARDGRRIQEINAIGKAMEIHWMSTNGICDSGAAAQAFTYCPVQNVWFTTGGTGASTVPTDPLVVGTTPYCMGASTTAPFTGTPAMTRISNCVGASWSVVAQGVPAVGTKFWQVCAALENGGIYCQTSQQQ